MLPEKPIPDRACTKSYAVKIAQDIVWIWAGNFDGADHPTIPLIDELEGEEIFSVDYLIDLPYDQTYLIENVIDVAHIHTAHHRLRGGGHRSMAKPIKFEVGENSARGISSTYQSVGLEVDRSTINSANISFVAPNLIHYTRDYKNKDRIAGLALYSLPLARGKCRLLYRKYSNFYSWQERAKPRFIEHWIQNAILQQDMALIIGQYDEVERSHSNLRDVWLPIKSSDTLVVQYRQWLDKYATNAPMFRGFSSHSNMTRESDCAKPANSIFELHTRQCASCKKAYKWAGHLQFALLAIIAVLLPVLLVLNNAGGKLTILILYLICLVASVAVYYFQRKFE